MSLIQFQCPTCGGPLEDPGEGTTMRCPYCITVFMVPQELIAARSSLAAPPPSDPAVFPASGGQPKAAEPEAKYFYEDFSSPRNGWDVGWRSGGVKLGYVTGGYQIYLSKDDSGWEAFLKSSYTDVAVEVELARSAGPKDGEFGLTCRVCEVGGYSFWMTGEGRYGICKFYYGETEDDEEEYIDLAYGKAGFLQFSGGFNRLKASCVGRSLVMFLNGKKVLEAVDDEFTQGDIGLMAQTGESDRGGLDIRFRSLAVNKV